MPAAAAGTGGLFGVMGLKTGIFLIFCNSGLLEFSEVSSIIYRKEGVWYFNSRVLSPLCLAQVAARRESFLNCTRTRYLGIRFRVEILLISCSLSFRKVSLRYFSTIKEAIGAACAPPYPPFSTTTATAIFGFSRGAKQTK